MFFSKLQLFLNYNKTLKEILYDLLGKDSEQKEFIGQTPISFLSLMSVEIALRIYFI